MDGGVAVLVRQPCLITWTWKAQPCMGREELAEHCHSYLGLSNPWHPGTEELIPLFWHWVWLLLPVCPKLYFWSPGNVAAPFSDERVGYTCKPAGYIRWKRNLAMSALAFDSLDFAWNLSSGARENSSHFLISQQGPTWQEALILASRMTLLVALMFQLSVNAQCCHRVCIRELSDWAVPSRGISCLGVV